MIVGMELRALALHALAEGEPGAKVRATQRAWAALQGDTAWVDAGARLAEPGGLPGRPARPVLVEPAQVPRRSAFTPEGRSALLHAVAHIEFNAIDLALDAVWRFHGMPEAYYRDWLRVAAEEAHHFSLLQAHLATLGHAYGDHCLNQVAALLHQQLPPSGGMVARLGGEEFGVVLADTPAPEAAAIAERMRQAVAQAAIDHPDPVNGLGLTISLGLASWTPQPGSRADLDALLQLADDCLYAAKREGRDRLVREVLDSAPRDPARP